MKISFQHFKLNIVITESILQKYRIGSYFIGNRFNFFDQNGCFFYFTKKLKGMILNVFYRHTRTQEV